MDYLLYYIPTLSVPELASISAQQAILQLVRGCSLALSWSLSDNALEEMDSCFRAFYNFCNKEIAPGNLSASIYRPVLHYLHHISSTIKCHGPLPVSSCRSLERTIGLYKRKMSSRTSNQAQPSNLIEKAMLRSLLSHGIDVEEEAKLFRPLGYTEDTWDENEETGRQLWSPFEDVTLSDDESLFEGVKVSALQRALSKYYQRFYGAEDVVVDGPILFKLAGRAWISNKVIVTSTLYARKNREHRRANHHVFFMSPFLSSRKWGRPDDDYVNVYEQGATDCDNHQQPPFAAIKKLLSTPCNTSGVFPTTDARDQDTSCIYKDRSSYNGLTKAQLYSLKLLDIMQQYSIPREAHRNIVRLMNSMITGHNEMISENRKSKILHCEAVERMLSKRANFVAPHLYDTCPNGCYLFNNNNFSTKCPVCNSARYKDNNVNAKVPAQSIKLLSIGDTFSKLLSNDSTRELLLYRSKYQCHSEKGKYQDYFDGSAYQDCLNKGLFKNPDDQAVALFVDGFVNSKRGAKKYTMIHLVLLNHSPGIRYKQSHHVQLGIVASNGKVAIDSYLQPILSELHYLEQHGMKIVKRDGTSLSAKCYMVFLGGDIPGLKAISKAPSHQSYTPCKDCKRRATRAVNRKHGLYLPYQQPSPRTCQLRTIGSYKKLMTAKISGQSQPSNLIEKVMLRFLLGHSLDISEEANLICPPGYSDNTWEEHGPDDEGTTDRQLWNPFEDVVIRNDQIEFQAVKVAAFRRALSKFYRRQCTTTTTSNATILEPIIQLKVAGRAWIYDKIIITSQYYYSKKNREFRRGNNYVFFTSPFLSQRGVSLFGCQLLAFVEVMKMNEVSRHSKSIPVVLKARPSEVPKFAVISVDEDIMNQVGLVKTVGSEYKFSVIVPNDHFDGDTLSNTCGLLANL
ncbi:hypothetical protein HMPREF1544_01972 [Mucor circinelloides 1006PhL]|uniref:Uncharacterized protein n=1 Tax=Mucor circinelloides f. circinelloides (strain 1006PhL) TaxID=1220926 RepID=S2JRE8_MUCC1|nr:hypothetical protein HMPREF1544_01972 [Mucor circinelloides 1006PhL]